MSYIHEFHKILTSLFEFVDTQPSFPIIGTVSSIIGTIIALIIYIQKIIFSLKRSKKNKANNIAISLIYIKHLKKNSVFIAIVTSGFILCTIYFRNIIYQLSAFYILTVILFFNLFLLEKNLITEYRIRKGLFGTNCTEARKLIDFIIKNSDNLDFTDSNGNLRRTLLPEAKDAVEEHIPGTLGEEARA